jgi:CBS domain-containing protein
MAIDRPLKSFMRHPVSRVAAGATLEEAAARMRGAGVSDLLVEDDAGAPVGVVSRTDLLRVGRIHARGTAQTGVIALPARPVGDIMTQGVVALPAEAALARAAALMLQRRIHRIFVGAPGAIEGVISTHEMLLAIIEARIATPLATVMSTPVLTVGVTDPVWVAADGLGRTGVHGVVVLEDGHPVGLFTQADALAARDAAQDTPVGDVMDHALVALPAELRLHRAAAIAAETRARRVLALRADAIVGILSGLDFARAIADAV